MAVTAIAPALAGKDRNQRVRTGGMVLSLILARIWRSIWRAPHVLTKEGYVELASER